MNEETRRQMVNGYQGVMVITGNGAKGTVIFSLRFLTKKRVKQYRTFRDGTGNKGIRAWHAFVSENLFLLLSTSKKCRLTCCDDFEMKNKIFHVP
jgi:hypothetical protein